MKRGKPIQSAPQTREDKKVRLRDCTKHGRWGGSTGCVECVEIVDEWLNQHPPEAGEAS